MGWHFGGALVFFVLVAACTGCGAADTSGVTLDPGAGPVVPPPSIQLGPAAPYFEPLELAPGEVCFRVEPELEATYPTIRTAATEALARWGWGLVFDDACESVLDGVAMDPKPDGSIVGASHHAWQMPDGTRLTAAQGGASRVVFNLNTTLFVGSFEECQAGEPRAMLMRVLTHEFGHMLGLGEDPSDTHAAMYPRTQYCWDVLPTVAEVSASLQP